MTTTPSEFNSRTTAGQTVEFPCAQCKRLLKVAQSAIGMQAKCPQCESIQTVPTTVPSDAPATPPTNVPADSAQTSHHMNPLPKQESPNDFRMFDKADTVDWDPSTNEPPTDVVSSTADTVEWVPPSPTVPSPPQAASPQAASPQASAPHAFDPPPPTLDSSIEVLGESDQSFGTPPIATRDTPTRNLFERITNEISKIFIGQDELVLGTLTALFSSGHVLIESVPGLGKTLFVRTLGRVLGCDFGRIQFTADLMPSDITGAPIFDMKAQEFTFRPGPVFTQLLLGDEINRSPAKTHAALLEIMQEYRVTVDGQSHELERPFLVMATQNPIESEGTYNLPEAQLDRFMFKLVANYPGEADEAKILDLHSRQLDINEQLESELETVTSPEEILRVTQENAAVRIDPRLLEYINRLVRLTREWPQFHMGASPRAGIALVQGARTLAAFHGRDYAVPDDVVQIAIPALRHRVILTAEAEVEGQAVDQLLTNLIRSIEVPRL